MAMSNSRLAQDQSKKEAISAKVEKTEQKQASWLDRKAKNKNMKAISNAEQSGRRHAAESRKEIENMQKREKERMKHHEDHMKHKMEDMDALRRRQDYDKRQMDLLKDREERGLA